jgi:hypothetical protein
LYVFVSAFLLPGSIRNLCRISGTDKPPVRVRNEQTNTSSSTALPNRSLSRSLENRVAANTTDARAVYPEQHP